MKSYQEFNNKLDDIKYSTDPERVIEKLYELVHEMLEVMKEKEVKRERGVQSWEDIPDTSHLFLDEDDDDWLESFMGDKYD